PLRLAEDLVPADPAPADGRLAVYVHELEGRPTVGPRAGPGELQDARYSLDRPNAEPGRPMRQGSAAAAGVGFVDAADSSPEQAALVLGKARVVGLEALGTLVLHSPTDASRSARKLS